MYSRMVLSSPAVATQRPSGEMATARIGRSCPRSTVAEAEALRKQVLPMLAAIRHVPALPLDIHIQIWSSMGGFNRMWEGSEMARVTVDKIPPEFEEAVQQAADECPVEAIVVE